MFQDIKVGDFVLVPLHVQQHENVFRVKKKVTKVENKQFTAGKKSYRKIDGGRVGTYLIALPYNKEQDNTEAYLKAVVEYKNSTL